MEEKPVIVYMPLIYIYIYMLAFQTLGPQHKIHSVQSSCSSPASLSAHCYIHSQRHWAFLKVTILVHIHNVCPFTTVQLFRSSSEPSHRGPVKLRFRWLLCTFMLLHGNIWEDNRVKQSTLNSWFWIKLVMEFVKTSINTAYI